MKEKLLKRFEEEIGALERELKMELPKEIQRARELGDLRENAEYQAALERQTFVRARISELRTRLGELNSISLDRIPRDRAGLGSRVLVLDLDTELEIRYELVVPEVADLERGLISVASPVGQGLLNRVVGDTVEVAIPAGRKRFEVLQLSTLHDKGTDTI